MKRKSFIAQLFIYMAVVLILIGLVIGYVMYQYAYHIVATEVGQFSKGRMDTISNEIGNVVVDEIYLSERIAYNSEVIERLKKKDDLQEIIDPIMSEYMWLKTENRRRLIDVYVMQDDKAVYKSSYDAPELLIKPELLAETTEIIITDTIKDDNGRGIYRHVFQIIQPIRDHFTKEHLGQVVLNITEKTLYDVYEPMQSEAREYLIVNEEGYIISAKDKRKIGMNYIEEAKQSKVSLVDDDWRIYTKSDTQELITYMRIPGTEWYLIEELQAAEYMAPLINIKKQFVFGVILFVLLSMMMFKQFAKRLIEPVEYIKGRMALVTKGDLRAYMEPGRQDEFGEIAVSFNEMLDQINGLLDEVKDTEQKKRLAELDFLRAQINPHFIYNTLSSIRFLVEMGKNEEAEDMLFYFSKILRATLSSSNQYISVREEIETIKNYVNLQKIRYPGSFEVEYQIDEMILDEKIINFILQPIVENSIFYSNQKKEEVCKIVVAGARHGEVIELSITDNGIGMSKEKVQRVFDKEQQMNSIGMRNVHERIQLHYGKAYGIEVLSEEGEGVKVIFRLPGR